MKQTPRDTLISQIFELFDTGEEAIRFLDNHGLEKNRYLLEDLETLCTAIAAAIEQISDQIELKNKLREIGLNAPLSVSRVKKTLDEGNLEGAYMQYACTFAPLFYFWRRYTEFFAVHAADKESMKNWYAEERERIQQIREAPKQDGSEEYRYDLSIVVLFYGNQKMTKDCLDAIERYTKGHSYELITFDNGSGPETTAWCESLPHVKKIYYTHNMGSSAAGNLIFTMAPYYMEGKYLLYVSNDVIVTPHYDEILWNCMESDPRIAMAAPVCNSASNYQAISVPYAKNDLKGMLAFAKGYNRCDPRKWEERARLFPILGCYRPRVLQQMKLAFDPSFCYDMFADDDHSLAIRRMGYRQMLCKDVFVHHYGSATIGEGQFYVMDLGRAQFQEKHGVDAWGALGTDLYISVGKLSFNITASAKILALNPLFGEGVLALCNRLRMCGCTECTVDALTEDSYYLDDMKGLFRHNGMLREEEQTLDGLYDFVLAGCNLNRCADLRAVLRIAAERLKPGGLFFMQYENFFSVSNLNAALQGKLPEDRVFLHDPAENFALKIVAGNALEALLKQEGLSLVQSLPLTDNAWKQKADQLLAALGIRQQKSVREMLISSGTFQIWKKGF